MNCETLRDTLAEYVAAGEPVEARYDCLCAHLQNCKACAQDLVYLRRVELALRAWPLEEVSVPLRDRLLATLDRRQQLPNGISQPWSIWLPALTVSAAVALALLLAPTQLSIFPQVPLAESELVPMASILNQEATQAIMVGIAAALAGIGITTALAQGGLPGQDELGTLRARASHAVAQLLRAAGHSH